MEAYTIGILLVLAYASYIFGRKTSEQGLYPGNLVYIFSTVLSIIFTLCAAALVFFYYIREVP